MSLSSKNRKMLIPINMNIFKRHTSEISNENCLNKSFKKFVNSEEKNYEILNNAFSPYTTNYRKDSQPKRNRSRGNTKMMTLRFPLYKAINQDKNDKSKNSINNFLKGINNPIDIKGISKYKIKDIYSNTFNNLTNNKLPKLKENKKDLLINKKKINSLSSNIINININFNNINTEKNIIKKRNSIFNEKNRLKANKALNKTDDLFNSFKKSKKILNFIQFYNKNTCKKEPEKSNTISIKTLSFNTTNNILQNNMNQNKLYYDIKEIKDINSIFKNKIEKTEIKLNLKSKKFKKRYKKNEIKYFENEDLKVMKNNKLKNKLKILDFKKYSQKEINKPKKLFCNNYKKKITVSEEIKLRKKKEKYFYDLIDNIMLNNSLYVYDINKIDKRLKLKKEKENNKQ